MIVPRLHGGAFRERFKDSLRKAFSMPRMGLLRLHDLKTRDLKNPGQKVGSRPKLVCLSLHHEKSLLQHVLRRTEIWKERKDKPLDPRLMVNEMLEYFLKRGVAHYKNNNTRGANLSNGEGT